MIPIWCGVLGCLQFSPLLVFCPDSDKLLLRSLRLEIKSIQSCSCIYANEKFRYDLHAKEARLKAHHFLSLLLHVFTSFYFFIFLSQCQGRKHCVCFTFDQSLIRCVKLYYRRMVYAMFRKSCQHNSNTFSHLVLHFIPLKGKGAKRKYSYFSLINISLQLRCKFSNEFVHRAFCTIIRPLVISNVIL